MNLAPIKAKTHTTTTTTSDYLIPGVDKSLAFIKVTSSTVQPSGKTSTVVEVINAVKDKNLKVLKECQPELAKIILLQVVFQTSYLLGVIIAPIETETQSIQKELNKLNTVPVAKVSHASTISTKSVPY